MIRLRNILLMLVISLLLIEVARARIMSWQRRVAISTTTSTSTDTNAYTFLYTMGNTNGNLLVDEGGGWSATNAGPIQVIAWTNQNGIIRKAFDSDGLDDQIVIADSAKKLFSQSSAATIGGWFKPQRKPSGTATEFYFGTTTSAGGASRFTLRSNSNGWSCILRDTAGGSQYVTPNVTASAFVTNQWYFVLGSFDSSGVYLSVNATQVSSIAQAFTNIEANASLTPPGIMHFQYTTPAFFADGVARYVFCQSNTAMSASAQTNLYNISAPWSDTLGGL